MHVPRVSRKDILHDIDDSLKNLQVDYVDLYWLHHDDEKISVEEIIDTLFDLVREGKIRYFGCSNWNTARIRQTMDPSGILCIIGSRAYPNCSSDVKITVTG